MESITISFSDRMPLITGIEANHDTFLSVFYEVQKRAASNRSAPQLKVIDRLAANRTALIMFEVQTYLARSQMQWAVGYYPQPALYGAVVNGHSATGQSAVNALLGAMLPALRDLDT